MVAFPRELRGRPDRLTRFTDETSLDSRNTRGQKVPVYATVPADADIGWYHDLVAHFPDAPGEVKSTRVLAGFEALPPELKARIWKGLREIGVHVSDPRPYVGFYDEAVSDGLGRPVIEEELKYWAVRGDPVARHILEDRERFAGQEMLSGSIVQRLHDVVDDAIHRAPIAPPWDQKSVDLTVAPFKKGKASSLRRIAEYTAKGSAAFADALERAHTYGGEADCGRFWTGPDSTDLIHRGTLKELEDGHAFDRGDARALERLEQDRQTMVAHLARSAFYGLEENEQPSARKALVEMDSKDDTRIQAADVAAGLVKQVLEREGLPGVVRRWSRVFYNGGRITENNLEATLAFWQYR